MDVLTADNDREGRAERQKIQGYVGMEKDNISPQHGHRNILEQWKFPNYGVAVGQHKHQGDYKSDNLPFIDLAYLLRYLF